MWWGYGVEVRGTGRRTVVVWIAPKKMKANPQTPISEYALDFLK
jgi:hypothetical protein